MGKRIKEKVMVIDDDSGVLDAFEVLFGDDYNLILAENGYKALKVLCSENPSLIFMDIMMPGLNGLEVLDELRRQKRTYKVILITALEEESYRNKGVKLGVIGFLNKPFDIDEARRVVEGVLKRV